MSNGNENWNKNRILALIGVVLTGIGLLVTITLPEIRAFLGLEEETTTPTPEVTRPVVDFPQSKPITKQEAPKASEPENSSGPISYTIYEDQPQFVETAQTNLSVAFNNVLGEEVASLTIAPAGKASSTHAVLTGYTQEFTSPAGTFLVQVLYVDYSGKNIQIQVTQTTPDNPE